MRNLCRVVLMCALPFFTLVHAGCAQDALVLSSATVALNGVVTLSLNLTSPTGSEPAAIQWTLSYPPANIISAVAVAGPSAVLAGKSLNCSAGASAYTCVLSGRNINPIPNGNVAIVSLVMSAGAARTSIQVANTIAASSGGFAVRVTAAGGVVTGGAQPSISALTCIPGSVSSFGTAACKVTLTAPAPSGGATVNVTSNNAQLVAPALVTIGAGASSATFNATATAITSNQTATLTATYNGTATASVGLTAPVKVTSVSCNPASLGGNASATCTVTLTQAAPAGGTVVTLTDTSAVLTTPPSMTVAAGATSGSFRVSTGAVAVNQAAVLTASYNGTAANTTVHLTASAGVSSLVCAPAMAANASATCTVSLTQAAPAGGAAITLTSSAAMLRAPASVSIGATGLQATFTVSTGAVANNQTAVVTASYNGTSVNANIALQASTAVLSALVCGPTTLGSNVGGTCTVRMTDMAPAGGARITIANTNSVLSAPASITIAAGASALTFSIAAGAITGNQTATLTATYNGNSKSWTVNLAGTSVTVSGLNCTPASLGPHSSGACTVTLAQPAPAGGTTAAITDSTASLTTPASVNVNAGASSATFNVTTGAFAANQSARVTATVNGSTANATVNLVAVAPSSLTCTPQTIVAGTTAGCHVTISQASTTSSTLLLTSNNANVVILTTAVVIPSGGLSADFKLFVSAAITANQTATVMAGLNGVNAVTMLSLQKAGSNTQSRTSVERISCLPKAIVAGRRGVCRLELTEPGEAVEIALTSSSPSVRLPATVTAREGQKALEFRVDAVGAEDTITVGASLNTRAVQDTISVGRDRGTAVRTPGTQFVRYGEELRFQVSAAHAGTRLRSGPLPDGATFDPEAGEFRWTPGGAQMGAHEIGFTAWGPDKTPGSETVKVNVESGEPVVQRIVNAASRSEEMACSPGAIAAIEGRWLSSGESTEDPSGASTELGGTKVWVSGTLAPVLSASSSRLTVLCPNAAPGVDLEFTVQTDHGTATPRHTQSRSAAAGLFSLDGSGNGQGLTIVKPSGKVAMIRNGEVPSQPAGAGELLAVYATGIEQLTNVKIELSDMSIAPNAISQVVGKSGLFEILLSVPEIKTSSEISLYLTGLSPEGLRLSSNKITVSYETNIQ